MKLAYGQTKVNHPFVVVERGNCNLLVETKR